MQIDCYEILSGMNVILNFVTLKQDISFNCYSNIEFNNVLLNCVTSKYRVWFVTWKQQQE